VSLLDPLDPEQAAWNREMDVLLKEYAIPFIMRPLPATDLSRATEIAREVQLMPEPVTVIAPFTPWEDGKPRTRTQSALAFISAYAKVAPRSYAAKPSWKLNHAARGDSVYGDTTAGTVEK
jgi:hypothetical protein